MLKCYFHIIYNLVTIHLTKFDYISVKIIFPSSFFFFFLPGMGGVNNFTTISMCGAEFHANEVCQQCDNLNIFKQKTNAQNCCCLDHCSF